MQMTRSHIAGLEPVRGRKGTDVGLVVAVALFAIALAVAAIAVAAAPAGWNSQSVPIFVT